MRDFPVFTTENGVGSLIFREVPYRGEAYIRIQSTQNFPEFLKECVDFSRAVGAERIYAAGHPELEKYPFHTAVVAMAAPKEGIGETESCLFPVTEQTLSRWREIYNKRMAAVPNASWMTEAMAYEMLRDAEGYFVHENGQLLGIGRVSGSKISAVAACQKGAGETVVKALCHAITGETVTLEVASANEKAVRLYEKLGFVPQREISRWYRVDGL